MKSEEIKYALLNRVPVIYKSKYGEREYGRIQRVITECRDGGRIHISLELVDKKRGDSTITVPASQVYLKKQTNTEESGREAAEESQSNKAINRLTPAQEQNFNTFWASYPRKVGKLAAIKAWLRIQPDVQLYLRIIAKVKEETHSEQWQKDNGSFIPHPATWLNQGRWDDEPVEIMKGKSTASYDLDLYTRRALHEPIVYKKKNRLTRQFNNY